MSAEIAASRLLDLLGTSMWGSTYGWIAAIGQAVTHRATGGAVLTGKTYPVGERGPELFSLSAAKQLGRVIEVQTKAIINRALQPAGIFWKRRHGVTA